MNIDRRQLNTPPRRTATRACTPARAFTLIEILIVIALTAVLFALLLIPLISALRYTQQAQIVTAAQDAARITKERITRELSSAVFVFDGTSHPFVLASGVPQPGDDQFTNFLDLQILDKNGASVVAHAYDAKLDFVLPKLNDNGGTTDPTTGEPITYSQSQNGSAIISNPSYVFPLAAGPTMIRYFVGLKDPTQPYNNSREGVSTNKPDNTYILYRAQFQPYIKSGNTVVPNPALFTPRRDKNNNLITPSIPELDDPDFFRYVSANDVDWLDDNHNTYGTTTLTGQDITSHNARVDKWIQISKAVIPGPNVDLILLPHNADNTLNYDAGASGPCTATTCPAVAHSGIAHDPVADGYYPIVNTSVTFRPATISGNATPGTTADYNAQGVVSVDQAGFIYIPTVYNATSQSWSLPFHVGVYPGNYNSTAGMYAAPADALSMYYDTEQFAGAMTTVAAPAGYPPTGYAGPGGPLFINPGDILEYSHITASNAEQDALVYDVTQGFPVTAASSAGGTVYTLGGTGFVPMTINPDTGTISFTAPSLPNGPYDRLTRQWQYGAIDMTSIDTQNLGGIGTDGTVDLTLPVHATPALTDSPLTGTHLLTASGTPKATGVGSAHIVPGSVRVTGPDQTSGPNQGQPITYTEANPSVGSGSVSDNQYYIDYGTSILHLLPGTTGVSIIYDYQANMAVTDPTAAFSASNPYLPMQVTVDYQTRDLIDVNIGVRIYDITTNRAQVLPTETKIKIGNSNR